MVSSERNLVIGGGLAGLCTAYHLVLKGEPVILLERGLCGHEASSKAAGMITPAAEVFLGEDRLVKTFIDCADYYPTFIDQLTKRNPNLVDFHQNGSLMCATDNDGIKELRRLKQFQTSMGLDVQELSSSKIKQLEPYLSAHVRYATIAPQESHVDNNRLLKHLIQYLSDHELCEILENTEVQSFETHGDRIESIKANDQVYPAKQVYLTTGLHNKIEGIEDLEKILPMRPVKGQVVIVKNDSPILSRPLRIFHRYHIYVVPRSDGRIVIGATSEELTDKNITAGGLLDLIYAAWQSIPLIYELPVVETRAGLRPSTPDHKPIVGRSHLDNLYYLTGLYRHGIMASPYLSQQLVALSLDQNTELHWNEYTWQRFHQIIERRAS